MAPDSHVCKKRQQNEQIDKFSDGYSIQPLKAAVLMAAAGVVLAAPLFAVTAPVFTSGAAVSFPQGIASSFTIVTSGDPIAAITQSGRLPGGVKFTDNGGRHGNPLRAARKRAWGRPATIL